ncbi:hypothetical protein [Pontibacter liquoris]|uniref:hypothetical protein n=1 Tax=Pontibacter liquoris TaxID=2905677 RepID=UPI001FA6C2FE|nr:hypothetical protein [Pontibacter liquoris]
MAKNTSIKQKAADRRLSPTAAFCFEMLLVKLFSVSLNQLILAQTTSNSVMPMAVLAQNA